MKREQNLENSTEHALNIPVVSGWRSFGDEKPLDGKRYYYSQGNQFFKGVWFDKLKGFLLDGCGGKYISGRCDYFHALNRTISGTSSTLYINTVDDDTPLFTDQKTYEDDLKRRQKEHLDNIHNNQNRNWQPCLHDSCSECLGTGIRKDGSPCIHNISCPCPKCNPYS